MEKRLFSEDFSVGHPGHPVKALLIASSLGFV